MTHPETVWFTPYLGVGDMLGLPELSSSIMAKIAVTPSIATSSGLASWRNKRMEP